jgi:hypothetical protein
MRRRTSALKNQRTKRASTNLLHARPVTNTEADGLTVFSRIGSIAQLAGKIVRSQTQLEKLELGKRLQ